MTLFWIMGAGHFGQRSVRAIRKRYPGARMVVVDSAGGLDTGMDGPDLSFHRQDAADFMGRHLGRLPDPDLIIPVVPIHLAFQWVLEQLPQAHDARTTVAVPETVATRLPNPSRGPNGELYLSYADFLCPENCSEKGDICTYTRRPRPGVLWQTLRNLKVDGFSSVVVQSRQLAPGIGGFTPEDLRLSLAAVRQAPGPVLFSTACKCHGVMNALARAED